jgi:hypothetical protein
VVKKLKSNGRLLLNTVINVKTNSWSRVLPGKLKCPKLLKKFPAFYGTRRSITIYTRARHLSLSWARSIQSAPPHPTSQRSILILSSHLCLGLPSGLHPSGFSTKALYVPLLPPYVPHVLPISVFLTWSPEWCLVRSTEHKALCYAVFSTPLLPHPSWAQISSSALYSQKPSAYIPPSMWVTNFHNHIKQPARL